MARAPKAAAEKVEATDTTEAPTGPEAPVYDKRGNVRPRGTEGARPMSYAERVAIAKRLQAGEQIVTTGETAAE